MLGTSFTSKKSDIYLAVILTDCIQNRHLNLHMEAVCGVCTETVGSAWIRITLIMHYFHQGAKAVFKI
jgi:hypothetical protein